MINSSLLPEKDDLFKITENWTTFSETPFQDDFVNLNEIDKLQIINDIVRQTMLFKRIPNPSKELNNLVGDSYTASIVSLNYLKHLKIGCNFRLALANNHNFNRNSVTNEVVLLLDYNGITYYFNSSPYIGFGIGKVCRLDEQQYYEEIIELPDNEIEKINCMRKLLYKNKNCNITKEECLKLKSLLLELKEKKYSPYEIVNTYNEIKFYNQMEVWKDELNELIALRKDYKRQIELAQSIINVELDRNLIMKRYTTIDGKVIPLSELSPRYFYENKLVAVCLKPSSYLIGINEEIKAKIVDGHKMTGNYMMSLGDKSPDLGLERMIFFHPHGNKYLRSMKGPNEMFLVHNSADSVNKIKKEIRNGYANDVKSTNVIWFDNKPIYWDPIITNLIHSTDDACETSLHYVSGFPEYSLMTRFMYPNPILRKEQKK